VLFSRSSRCPVRAPASRAAVANAAALVETMHVCAGAFLACEKGLPQFPGLALELCEIQMGG
jgi:hypothetical protein